MKVEIRDITKEEAVPYGDNADIVLAERNAETLQRTVRSLADLPQMRCLVDGRELHPPERHVSEWDADGNRPLR